MNNNPIIYSYRGEGEVGVGGGGGMRRTPLSPSGISIIIIDPRLLPGKPCKNLLKHIKNL